MKSAMVLVIYILTGLALHAQPREWLWAQRIGGEGLDEGCCVASDNNGNGYITGSTYGCTIGGSTIEGNIFVAKYDKDGNWQWSQGVEGSGAASKGVAVDSQGNVFITGCIRNLNQFGSISVNANTYGDVFIAKLDTEGNWLWVRKSEYGQQNATGHSIAIDNNDNVLVTGRTTSGAYFGSYGVNGSNGNLFVVKLDNAGNWLWASAPTLDSTYNDYAVSITTDSINNVFICGMLPGLCVFNGQQEGGGTFIAKLSSTGGWGWIKVCQYDGVVFNNVCTDDYGNVFLAGWYSGHVEVGGTPLDSSGGADVLMAKLNGNGVWQWVRRAGGASNDFGYSACVDPTNIVYVSGYSFGSASFGTISLSQQNNNFIACINQNGEWLMALEEGDGQDGYQNYISIDPMMGLHFVCNFYSPTVIAGQSLETNGSIDIAIARYGYPYLDLLSPNGGEIWQAGTEKTVYWQPSGTITPLNIMVSANNGADWIYLNSTPISADLGHYMIQLPMIQSSECLIKIISSEYPDIWNDISDSVFSVSISPPPRITITSDQYPQIKYKSGNEYQVTWVSTHASLINVDVSYDAGVSWSRIAENYNASQSELSWIAPYVLSEYAYFRVSDSQNPMIYDWSNYPFTICKLEIDSPTEGDIWIEGTSRTISWECGNIDQIHIEYSVDNAETWNDIIETVNAAYGSYDWLVPKHFSTQSKLRISDATDLSIYDVSETNFSIRPQIMLISPNGGEYLLANSIHRIMWDSTIEVTHVLMDYSVNNGSTWQPIQSTPYNAGLGYYDWIVPNTPGNQVLVRIKKANNTAIYGVSGSVFSIVTQIMPPVADFVADNVYGFDSMSVSFTDMSQPGTGLITSWEWVFGDGGTSSEQNPQHTYLSPGVYDVALTVTNTFMASDTMIKQGYITIIQSVPEVMLLGDRTLTFGSIFVQESSGYQPVSLQNTGGAALSVSGIRLMGDASHFEYIIPQRDVAVVPGETLTIMVRFSPLTVGAIRDTIYIENNSVNEPMVKVALTGTGLYVLPEPPQNINISMVGNNINLSWEPVTFNMHDQPITPEYYFIYISDNPYTGFVLTALTPGPSYTHPYITIGATRMFYRITAVKFYRDDLAPIELDSLLRSLVRIGMGEEEVKSALTGLNPELKQKRQQ